MTKNNKITPVILAGGSGTRLWPVSRPDVPKQFCRFTSENTLFQSTAKRVAELKTYEKPIVVVSERHADLAQRQLKEIDIEAAAIICEPEGKDTAAAILIAAELYETSDDRTFLVMPSDHLIENQSAWHDAVGAANAGLNEHELIVTFGIKPTHPETGFGYLDAGAAYQASELRKLNGFIEKPDVSAAEELIKRPNIFWNAGIFMFTGKTLLREFAFHQPALTLRVQQSIMKGFWNDIYFHPDAEAFSKIKAISFDYAIMEKTDCAATLPVDPQWSDMGSWQAVWEKNAQDENQNSLGKDCFVENSSGCLVQSNGPVVGVVGLDDIVVVAERDAVLVSHKDDAQNVKTLVAQLEANDAVVAQKHNGEDRPWGRFDSLDKGETHQVKRIRVSQGERLSLQYHHHRAEHWIVICGTATVTVDDKVKNLVAGEQVYIPLGAVHRLENLTDEPVEIIEVQIGTYFGEDDIVRIEDVYGRPKAHPKYSGRAA